MLGSERGRKLLISAVLQNDVDGIQVAVNRAGAHPDVTIGDHRKTPMIVLAARQGHQAALRTLVELGANPNAADSTGETAAIAVIRSGVSAMQRAEVLKAIAAAGGSLLSADRFGDDPLTISAMLADECAVRALIEHGVRAKSRYVQALVEKALSKKQHSL